MKFNRYLVIRGPGGEIETPDQQNPLENDDWTEALRATAMAMEALSLPVGVDVVGFRFEIVSE